MSQNSSRLDRLLNLLDSGSAAVRSVAAKQVGEATKYHQDEQPYVLAKVSQLLRSKCWETRVAAGEAISAISQFVPKFEQVHCISQMPHRQSTSMPEQIKKEEDELSDNNNNKDSHSVASEENHDNNSTITTTIPDDFDEKLSFSMFDVHKVMQYGVPLLAAADSDGNHPYDLDPNKTQLQKLITNKRNLRPLLGLNGPIFQKKKVESEDAFHQQQDGEMDETVKHAIDDSVDLLNMTASERRQYNQRKREAKKQKRPSKLAQNEADSDERATKKQKTADSEEDFDSSVPLKDDDHWAFYWLVERLRTDLFDPQWEIRHGAAIGLREIFTSHGSSAGKSTKCIDSNALFVANQKYLEDICICVLSVFILDQFTDFVSDQAVSPVRETCAQILAVVLRHTCSDTVKNIVQCLISLAGGEHWQVRHGGLLGLKYTIAIRLADIDELLPTVLPAIISAIDDSSDDVRSVAAEALVPVAEHIIRLAPKELHHINTKLWDILLDLDDLSSATASIMRLLAKFYALVGSQDSSSVHFTKNLSKLVPRLWPFLRHNLATVRRSAVDTLHKLITGSADCWIWLAPIFRDTLAYVFQNIILEAKAEIIAASLAVWDVILAKVVPQRVMETAGSLFNNWISLLATNYGSKMDVSLMVLPSSVRSALQYTIPKATASTKAKGRKKSKDQTAPPVVESDTQEHKSFSMRLMLESIEELIAMRIHGCRAIAKLASACYQTDMSSFFHVVQFLLDSEWAAHREIGSFIIQELYLSGSQIIKLPESIITRLLDIITNQQFSYLEMHQLYNLILAESNMLLQYFASANFDVASYYTVDPQTQVSSINHLSLEDATDVATRIYDFCVANMEDVAMKKETDLLRNKVLGTVDRYTKTSVNIHNEVMACISCAIVHANIIPQNIDSIIQALMHSLSSETISPSLQDRSSFALASLVHQCATAHQQTIESVALNLCGLLCANRPPITLKPEVEEAKKTKKSTKKKAVDEPEVKTKEQIAHRGASLAMNYMARNLGPKFFELLPCIWSYTGGVLCSIGGSVMNNMNDIQSVINAFHILTEIAPSVHEELHCHLLSILDSILALVSLPNEQILAYNALTVATLCNVALHGSMKIIIEKLFRMLADPKDANSRRGAVSVIYKIITTLDITILPYIVFFVVPLLRRMSDQDLITRELASNCFGMVINILPLENSASAPPGFEEAREKERKFIDQLLDNSKVEPYVLPIHINAELRQYQKDGISWMAFLNKYNLHGILCDDMGLGKTLQTICMIASDIFERKKMFQQTGSLEYISLPSLVVCPPTLVGHWYHEINQFCPDLKIAQYSGTVSQKKEVRDTMNELDVVIISYDVLRNDVDRMVDVQSGWNYCILDEGHIIKNKKAQVTRAVKMINANHRLILSGTPVQNNVIELWPLFDFLMPGFLGTEKEFIARYSKPIQTGKDAKATAKEQAEGTQALDALNRQILPFLLRRVKEDVLQDLPEKIIQDCYCDLTPLQARLYEEFSKSHMADEIAETLNHMAKNGSRNLEQEENKQHVFQGLQYLRKLCNHPCLVVNENHPQYDRVCSELQNEGKDLHDVSLSPKMLALKQLLYDCGIGNSVTANEEVDFMSQHRVLIFCQMKSVLDLIEFDLFKNHMPSVSYMRLDGTVEPSQRFGIVHKFNSDPTIDVLLLTTHVGGLGLNLTGADTVIFVEHDWDPSTDLQAMDRAHRIGQKKVVNVYRILTKNTLEEKLMRLEQFKLNISKAAVNTEDSDKRSMNTDRLVSLFQVSNGEKAQPTTVTGSSSSEPQTELWEEKQYEEFDINSFLKKLA